MTPTIITRAEARKAIRDAVKVINEMIPALQGEQVGDKMFECKEEPGSVKVQLILNPHSDRGVYKPLGVRFSEWEYDEANKMLTITV